MDYYLLIARSVTQAQHMVRALEQCGIRADMFRAPVGLTDRGCSYAVRVREEHLDAAKRCLRAAMLPPLHIFGRKNGMYREVEP